MSTTTLKPGLLVALRTAVSGGVAYKREDIEDGEHVAVWKTKVRGSASNLIRGACSVTTFGLLCPNDRETYLKEATAAAKALVTEYNKDAKHTQISLNVFSARIASTDEEAVRAISSEVAELLERMEAGIKKLDPKAIREAVGKAKEIAMMLGEDRAKQVSAAVEQAQKAARIIVKRVVKDGEQGAVVLAEIQRGAIASARMAFLDLSAEPDEKPTEVGPAVAVDRFAFLDVEAPELPAGLPQDSAPDSEDGPATMQEAVDVEDEPRKAAAGA